MKVTFITLSKKYSGLPAPLKASFWFTVCSFMQRGITMITTPIFTRVLSKEQYGIVSTFASWQSILLLVASLDLYASLMNLYVKYNDKEKVLSAVSGLSLVLTTIWAAVSFVFLDPLSKLLSLSKPLTVCLFVFIIAQAVIQCWMVYKRYNYSFKSVVIVTMSITAFSSFIGVLCVLFVSSTAEARIIPQTAVYAIIGIVLYISIFKKNKTFYDKKIWLFSMSFCLGLMPHYLSNFVLQSSDKIMINYMCGSRDVALYSIAYAVGSLILLVTNAINASFAPYQYQSIQKKKYKELSINANRVLWFVAVMLFIIMIFSKEIVLIFGGAKYLDSTTVIIPICIGVFFHSFFPLLSQVPEYFNRKLTVVIPSVMCAILNLVLNYIFIGIYGYKAAAYTTFICYLLFCMVHYLFYKRVCREKLQGKEIYDVKGISIISITVLVLGFVTMLISTNTLLKYLIVLLGLATALVKKNRIIEYIKKMLGKE